MFRQLAARRVSVFTAAVALVLTASLAQPAAADSAPVNPADPATPPTVTADVLPTVQIDGVVWSQVVVGKTVYAAGSFTTARPAGAAPGTNTVPRNNLLAFNIETGELVQSFAPNLNGQARAITKSPDGKRIYVVGDFNQVNGQWRVGIAAFDTATGALVADFRPTLSAHGFSVAASNTTVYAGGEFTSAASVTGGALQPRQYAAAFNASDGSLTPFVANANSTVMAMTLTTDGSKLALGGRFTTINGGDAYGLATVNPSSGAQIALPANAQIRDAGNESAILSLAADSSGIYGSGYHFGSGGNIEGAFRIDNATGQLVWVADCHGDAYSVFPTDKVVYVASHHHYCGNMGGFPQTEPWTFYFANAFSKATTGVNTPDIYGYPDHPGEPAPSLLNWYPLFYSGTYTGQYQAGWSVTGNEDYIVYGGEFPGANGTTQQGLVRFAKPSLAPKKQGPRITGAAFNPSTNSFAAGEVRVRFSTNWDRDNETLTYRLYRGSEATAPIYTETITTPFWKVLNRTYTDKGLALGSSQQYRLTATDPDGNVARSDWVTATVASSGTVGAYGTAVLDDQPASYWRLGEPSGTGAFDWAGSADLNVGTGVTRGTAGALTGEANTATTFAGNSNGTASTTSLKQAPNQFAVEAWFKTTTNRGGKIIGFGDTQTGASSNYDRQVYMNNAGRLYFGVYNGNTTTVNTTTAYNDGQWHHVVASLSGDGMAMYVDGVRVAGRADATTGQAFSGYWRIGGDNLGSWPSQPTSNYFAGAIDEVAVYDAPLTATQIRKHYSLSGRTANVPARPADAYGAAVYDAEPSLYWRFNETSGTAVADSGTGNSPATISGDYVRGGTGAIAGTTNRSLELRKRTGTNGGTVYSQTQFAAPTAFSTEAWFNTTSTQGGKIIGFGSAQTGDSSSYDRHVYMQDDGKLVFGTWTGEANIITTPGAYNNGQWHHVVATQDATGLRLYVDGQLAGTNSQSGAQGYVGYWRVGGDVTWGSTSNNLIGKYDEAAVYPRALSASEVAQHFALGKGAPVPNAAPEASFTATGGRLSAHLDASASADPDGSIASYAWSFGDAATGTGKVADHTYAQAGTYTVTLTVTDDDGATAQSTKQVVVTGNEAPTSSFAATTSGLSAHLDASASADPDGSIASYAWSFGDAATGTGKVADHTYAQAGTYTVTLTVTDNDGATALSTKQVVVTAAPVVTEFAKDNFGRTSTSGWGNADTGGAWTANMSASLFKIGGGVGTMTMSAPAAGPRARLNSVAARDVDLVVDWSLDKLSSPGSVIGHVALRSTAGGTEYRTKVFVSPAGAVTVELGQAISDAETSLGTVGISGLTYAPGDVLRIRTQTVGASPTTIRAKVWKVGTTEPTAWQISRTDSTTQLQDAGGLGVGSYLSSSSTNAPVTARWDSLLATAVTP